MASFFGKDSFVKSSDLKIDATLIDVDAKSQATVCSRLA